MHLDVLDLRNFYYRTPLGRVAQRAIRDQLVALARGQGADGGGLRLCRAAAAALSGRCAAGHRADAGAAGGDALARRACPMSSVLCEETHWPLPTGMVDKLVLMHGLETSEHPTALLEECWRVLGPGGRAVFVVPEPRRGSGRDGRHALRLRPALFAGPARGAAAQAWLHAERTLSTLYRAAHPAGGSGCARPLSGKGRARSVRALAAGGVLMVEASKQTHAPTRPGLRDGSDGRCGSRTACQPGGPQRGLSARQPGSAE